MKTLLVSTAVVLAFSSPALTQQSMPAQESFMAEFDQIQYRASNLIGATLWQTESDVDVSQAQIDPDALEWTMAGEIKDIVLGKDGQVDQIIAGVGGFLGLGEKEVSIKMDALTFVSDGADSDEWFVVFNGPGQMIKDAPDYGDQRVTWSGRGISEGDTEAAAAAPMTTKTDGTGTDATDTAETAMADQSMADRSMDDNAMTTEELTGVPVYTTGETHIGEVSKLILTEDGKSFDKAVIDVGGFLGLGEKPVAVELDKLTIMKSDTGAITRVTVDMSREDLEAMDAFTDS